MTPWWLWLALAGVRLVREVAEREPEHGGSVVAVQLLDRCTCISFGCVHLLSDNGDTEDLDTRGGVKHGDEPPAGG